VEVGNCLKGVYLYEKLRTYNHRVWYAEEHLVWHRRLCLDDV
jgi:hypothetical protein